MPCAAALFSTGRGTAPIDAIRTIYADHYPGHDLERDLKSELSGTDLTEAQAALSGDPVQQGAAALQNATAGIGTDEQKIHDTFAQINKLKDPAARERLAREFQRITGQSIDAMLRSELSGSDLKIAQKELQDDQAGADAVKLDEAMHGGFLGIGTDEQKIYSILEGTKDKTARNHLLNAYRVETGQNLSTDLDDELSGAEKDVAGALLSEDRFADEANVRRAAQARISASRLAVASQGIGTDEAVIFAQFEGVTNSSLREEIKQAFNERYGKSEGRDFDQMLASELSGNDLERAKQLVKQGQLDPAFALKYAMDGVGTDDELIRSTLKECKTSDALYKLREQYAALKGSTDIRILDQDLADELSGRDGFEVKQMLAGSETQRLNPWQKIAFANQAYDFERGVHAGAVGNFVTDLFSDSGRVLDSQHERLRELNDKLKAGTTTDADVERLQTVSNYHKQDVENYQAARDGIANTGAMLGTGFVGTAMTIATWGAAGPMVASVLGALAGGATNLGLKIEIQGDSYSTEDFATDVATTLVSAGTAGAAAGPITQVASKVATLMRSAPKLELMVAEALKGGQMGLANGAVAGLVDPQTWRGPGNGAENFFHHVGTSTIGGMATGLATAGTGGVMGPGSRQWKALGGAAGGVLGGGVQAMVDGGGDLESDTFITSLRNNVAANVLSGVALANLPHGSLRSHAVAEISPPPVRIDPASAADRMAGHGNFGGYGPPPEIASLASRETVAEEIHHPAPQEERSHDSSRYDENHPISNLVTPELDGTQQELQAAEMSFVRKHSGGNMRHEKYLFKRALPNGATEEYLFRPTDRQQKAAERARKELAAYKLSAAIGFDNGFPLSVERSLDVDGSSRGGWLQRIEGETIDNKGGYGPLQKLADQRYSGSGSPEEVVRLLREDQHIRGQAEQVLLERMLYGDGDDHPLNLIAANGKDGQMRLRNIDLDFGFSDQRIPQFGVGSYQGLTAQIHKEFSQQSISPQNLQRIQQFVSQYGGSEGQHALQQIGLQPEEGSAMLERAKWFLQSGKLPRYVSLAEKLREAESQQRQ